ncbi:hypothetical protein K474DRAFT_1651739 [Panus rudis PR-1116 ss-1]|nr:hypothetical protein K474DRAFT_1651739 [Panus rudis PR-1116 ss-1]
MHASPLILAAIASLSPLATAHIAFWHKSMFGFNVTAETFPYDNRPQIPLMDMTFQEWWMHNHLDYPPNPGDYFELPAGQTVNTELSCDKGATSNWPSAPGGDAGFGSNYPCPGQPTSQFHTTGIDDVKGCALAIAYKSDARSVQPEDFTVFSVNHTCVWYLNTAFQVPADMPPCPEDGCTCAWFWIHSPDSGAEQNYMNGFRCKVTNSRSTKPIGKPAVARRCGADPDNGVQQATPSNCTVGPKQPFYWYQKERNNMFEGTYSPPFYLPLYGFEDGAQNDIFQAPTPAPASSPAPAATPDNGGHQDIASPSAQNPAPETTKAASSSHAPVPETTKAAAPADTTVAPSSSVAPTTDAVSTSVAQITSAAPASEPSPSSPVKCKKRDGTSGKKKKRSVKKVPVVPATVTAAPVAEKVTRFDAVKRHVKRRLPHDLQ